MVKFKKHKRNNNEMMMKYTTSLGTKLDNLGKSSQLLILACGVFLFFGIHNILQEAIMKLPEFNHGIMLGYLEVLGVTVCSYGERRFIAKEQGRKAPLSAYPMLTLCLLSSSGLAATSLNYINFPTKVVFRSCKLIPTMVIASLLNKNKNKNAFTVLEYLCALAICLGLVLFTAADWTVTPDFNVFGILLVVGSTVADAILPNVQETLFTKFHASRLEVLFYTNLFTLGGMTIITTVMSNDLIDCFYEAKNNPRLQCYMFLYTFIAYIAVSVHMNIVKKFGGVTAVFVATMRKLMTLVLSFLLFPKAFSWFYVFGAILVLGGLMASSLVKKWNRNSSSSSSIGSGTATTAANEISGTTNQNNINNEILLAGEKMEQGKR